jgi:hypothetical protein
LQRRRIEIIFSSVSGTYSPLNQSRRTFSAASGTDSRKVSVL